jgi:DtxR family Mn-dependent transcriptional regulator
MKCDQLLFVLSNALEDYLETIFELVRDNGFARVKDISKARNVRSASVIPAMRRLSDLGLIQYVKREYINLTQEGENQARRIYARHRVMTRFFTDILGIPSEASRADACAMEHSLSDISMDCMVKFFEFLDACPEGAQFLKKFHGCSLIHDGVDQCSLACTQETKNNHKKEERNMSVKELKPGEKGRVARIEGTGAIRQRLLDMGIMSNVLIEIERVSPAGDPIWIKFQGTQLSLRKKEAELIVLAENKQSFLPRNVDASANERPV